MKELTIRLPEPKDAGHLAKRFAGVALHVVSDGFAIVAGETELLSMKIMGDSGEEKEKEDPEKENK